MQELSSSTMKTMSSRDITEVLRVSVGGNPEQRHDSVKRTIERLHKANALTSGSFTPLVENRISSSSQGGRPATEYMLNKLDSITVVAQLNPVVTAAIVKRWDELEQQAAKPKELSRMDLIQIAMESEQERLKLEAKVQEDAPKVKFAEAVATIASLKTVGEAAKVLGIGPNKLHAWMRENGWTNRDRTPSQSRVTQGHLTYRHGSYESFGVTVPTISTRITPKGFELLFRRLREAGMIR